MEFEDRFVTVTPEGISLDVVLAGLGSRFIAFAIDFLLQMVALVAFLVVAFSTFGNNASNTSTLVLVGAFALFALIDFIGYFIFFEMLFNGRSPGKQMTGLRVVRVGGQPVGFWSSLLRNVLRLVDMQLGSVYLVGSVLILSTSRNQRLGDLIANTLVIRERVAAETQWKNPTWTSGAEFSAPAWSSTAWSPEAPGRAWLPPELAHWDVSAVPDSELALARAFLANRSGYTDEARRRLGADLANRMWPLVAGPTTPSQPEQFLEAVVLVKSARS
ncbi:MAG TPA: RDD family protein [Acidimicrobiales bacterium]|nr:RDD family protein [Acidimicrobiales bacterium]